ncbi:MAG: preprotein translocase subunit SecY, partial [Persicimonas sp.]
IMQLMQVVVPTIERLQKEGEQGRKKITQYTRYGTLLLGIIQGFGIALYVENLNDTNPEMNLLLEPGWGFRLLTCITLAAGTVFLMWLGEQITERGIGNGISIIITASIIAAFPTAIFQTYGQFESGALSTFSVVTFLVMALVVTAFIVYMETAQRRIPLQYAKRMVGRRIYGGQTHHLPLKVNMAGVIPPIFAISLMMFPTTLASYFQDHAIGQWIQTIFVPGDWRYNLLFALMIIFFTFFYTAVQVNPVDIADNLKKSGAFVPGIRPGKKTAEYIDKVLSRLTVAGSVYLAAVCVLPFFVQDWMGVSFNFGGISLIIAVTVSLRTVDEIENHLVSRHYDEFESGTTRTAPRETGSGIAGRDRSRDEPDKDD